MAKHSNRQTREGGPAGRIWRYSRPLGHCEVPLWGRVEPADGWRLLDAAKLYERDTKKPGCHAGELKTSGIAVLEALVRLRDWSTGRLEPSVAYLASVCRLAPSTVFAALVRLQTAGFVDWVRRYVPTWREGVGPQVHQTSNAYRLTLPERARRLLERWSKVRMGMDDFELAKAERAAQLRAYADQADRIEQEATPLGGDLGAWAEKVAAKTAAQRESDYPRESPRHRFIESEKDNMSGVAAPPRPD